MRRVPLRGKNGDGKFALVDDEDFDFINRYKWHLSRGYAKHSTRKNNKRMLTSMQWAIILGELDYRPKSETRELDHIDGNKLNNQKVNLRLVSHRLNHLNRKSISKLGVRGVQLHKSKMKNTYYAVLNIWGKLTVIGKADTLEEAARLHDVAAIKYHGKFAKLNFPEEFKIR